jgi:hypothetical protein
VQHFFYAGGKFPSRMLTASLSTLASGAESEQALSLFNEA